VTTMELVAVKPAKIMTTSTRSKRTWTGKKKTTKMTTTINVSLVVKGIQLLNLDLMQWNKYYDHHGRRLMDGFSAPGSPPSLTHTLYPWAVIFLIRRGGLREIA